ncbi:MAG: porin family protein [Desulfuromonadales bacterium]|nr:porin family protein [Desulfuromonadales bacterium]
MNKILVSIVVMFLAVLCSNHVYATDVRPYLEAHVGAVFSADSNLGTDKVTYDPGLVAGGALGLDFEFLRIEANIDYRRADISKVSSNNVNSDLQLLSYMVNGHLVAPLQFPVKPYLLGGVGFATAFVSDFAGSSSSKQSNTRFSYEVGAGVGYEIKRNVTLDINYRYLGVSDFDFNGTRFSYSANNVLFGVRYSY